MNHRLLIPLEACVAWLPYRCTATREGLAMFVARQGPAN